VYILCVNDHFTYPTSNQNLLIIVVYFYLINMPPNPELIDKQQNKKLINLSNINNNGNINKLGSNQMQLNTIQQKSSINKSQNNSHIDEPLNINTSVRNNNQINNRNQFQQNNSAPNNGYNNYNTYGGYNSGMMGMGMGMMSPYMMGGGYGMMGGGPMSFIYSINYSIAMIGQLMTTFIYIIWQKKHLSMLKK